MTENKKNNRSKIRIKDLPSILEETYLQWVDDKALKLAASLSFYSILSLVPLLVIIVSTAGLVLGQQEASSSIITQVRELIGEKGAVLFEELMSYSFFKDTGIIPTVISAGVLLFGSLGVFIELKESLNIVWGIEVKPGKGFKLFFKNRLLTFPFIFGIGFLLITSLIISALIGAVTKFIGGSIPNLIPVLKYSDIAVSLIVFTILFGLLFKFLPDTKIKWSYVWQGALFTSILFNIGKYLIGFYLGNTYYGNVYGAAGSLVILLIWIYYSSIIFFFGAEFTYVIRRKYSTVPLELRKDFIRIKKTTQQLEESVDDKNYSEIN
ncbi:MAG: YihY/virulence factor BrkB family protein [Ignavibacteriae bacterium]|nr:YihY/virulence factor BrkB family protein [Ignavibacteriota bacterium]NOG97933.1 YihY/virulence factor BrkB family protein [Ignavibacteriota bacterium]